MKLKQKRLKKTLRRLNKKNINKVEKNLLDPEDITNALTEQESMSERKNHCVEGIVGTNNDSRENYEKQFLKIIKQKLEIKKNIETDRCYKGGKIFFDK